MNYLVESKKLIACYPYISGLLKGNGLDLGAGHEKVKNEALGIDFGSNGHSWIGDVTNLYWFNGGVLDYVFSSHCLEHVIDDRAVLCEWARVLKHGGSLVLYLPDDESFDNSEMVANGEHKHVYTEISLKALLEKVDGLRIEKVQRHTGEVVGYPEHSAYSLLAICKKI